MLLPVAARLRHGRRVGSYVVRQGTDTYDSRVIFRQKRQSSNAQSGCLRAEADATTDQTKLRQQEAGLDDEAGKRHSVDERGRDGLNSPRARFF